jgi:glycosyltransferase involved in cell wall biosynthesis
MAKRKRVGLIFSYNENWIAGAYYILNIVHALNLVDDSEKPNLIILTDSLDNFKSVQQETKYPYLIYYQFPFKRPKYSLFQRAINKLSRTVFNQNFIVKKIDTPLLDFVYPNQIKDIKENLKKINWIPDFQEDYLPHFFSEKVIFKRKHLRQNTYAKGDIVVLSSEDAKADYLRLYPMGDADTFVLPFAVTHPDFSKESISQLKEKYKLPSDYFFAPNQFWAHKNHIVILKAVKHLKERDINVTVAMSGKENDYRNKNIFNDLKTFISENELQSHIKFLGFLPRTEQLCLFKNAQAIIQPSLFEGWSTVVEDAKSLNKFIILSNLKVHKEQVKQNAVFFNPNDHIELSNKIMSIFIQKPIVKPNDYDKARLKFGNDFLKLINFKKIKD